MISTRNAVCESNKNHALNRKYRSHTERTQMINTQTFRYTTRILYKKHTSVCSLRLMRSQCVSAWNINVEGFALRLHRLLCTEFDFWIYNASNRMFLYHIELFSHLIEIPPIENLTNTLYALRTSNSQITLLNQCSLKNRLTASNCQRSQIYRKIRFYFVQWILLNSNVSFLFLK